MSFSDTVDKIMVKQWAHINGFHSSTATEARPPQKFKNWQNVEQALEKLDLQTKCLAYSRDATLAVIVINDRGH